MRLINRLVKSIGGSFSSELDISLQKEKGVFKWFLASILFGARISQTIAINTFKEFENEGITSPDSILKLGWDGLVRILDNGGYVRYDFKTADKLLEISKNLKENYTGSLLRLKEESKSLKDLENRLKALGKGIGNVTVNIFLRELRGIWKVDPLPGGLSLLSAGNLGIINPMESKRKSLERLKDFYKKESPRGISFIDFESSLVRLGKDYCRKKRCKVCILKSECRKVSL